jgi:hypothetical protein
MNKFNIGSRQNKMSRLKFHSSFLGAEPKMAERGGNEIAESRIFTANCAARGAARFFRQST